MPETVVPAAAIPVAVPSSTGGPTLALSEVSRLADEVLDEVELAVVGKRNALTNVLSGILAGGHVLIEDFPGLGKTLAARSFAQTLGLRFARAQFTPDLLPADLTRSFVYDQRVGEFSFRRGPLFTGLLFADEINRTPPKTQSALLEAMQERQITVEGETFALESPFHVIATANPVEYEGTYPLPEAQLDRFMLRISFGYPTVDEEWDVLRRRMVRQHEEQTLRQVTDATMLLAMQAAVERVDVDESIGRYCVALATATRTHPHVMMGSSPRGALALLLTSRAYAVVAGRDYVTPEDVKLVAEPVLAHRITVKPELWMSKASGASVVEAVVSSVPTPATLESSGDRCPETFLDETCEWRNAGRHDSGVATDAGSLPRRVRVHRDGGRSGAVAAARPACSGGSSGDCQCMVSRDQAVASTVVHFTTHRFDRTRGGSHHVARHVRQRGRHRLRCRHRTVERITVTANSSWGAFRWSHRTQPAQLISLPLPATFDSKASIRRSNGLVGLDRSARPGDGSEFAGIRPFQSGDRMRRINWPRSLRAGSLHVTSTWADQDTHVVLEVDATDDLGVSEGVDGTASSIDIAVRAAGAIAEHYLNRGDRVTLRVLGSSRSRDLPSATGRAHLRRVLDTLAAIQPGTDPRGLVGRVG